MMVCSTTILEKRKTWEEDDREQRRARERERERHRMKSRSTDRVIEARKKDKQKVEVWFRRHVSTVGGVCCEIVTVESFCVWTESELFVVGFYRVVACSLSVLNEDPRQSLGRTSMFVGKQEVQIGLNFFFFCFFSFAFLQKRVPDIVATIIIILIII